MKRPAGEVVFLPSAGSVFFLFTGLARLIKLADQLKKRSSAMKAANGLTFMISAGNGQQYRLRVFGQQAGKPRLLLKHGFSGKEAAAKAIRRLHFR